MTESAARSPLLVFDLDGTLVDSARDLADSTNDVLASYGCRPIEQSAIVGMVGEGARMLVDRALKAAGCPAQLDEALARFHAIYDTRLVTHTRPYDGIVDVLVATRPRARLAVLTNKPITPTTKILDALGLSSYFAWTIGGDGPFPRKPDPASLAHLIALGEVPPSRVLMIGDSIVDAEVARNAGTRFCLARYGFGQARGVTQLEPGEFAAEQPRDLTAVIAAFLNDM